MEEGDERYLDLFWTLSKLRTAGMSGPDPIAPSAISGWMQLQGIALNSEEVQIVLELDGVFRVSLAKESERNKPAQGSNAPLGSKSRVTRSRR